MPGTRIQAGDQVGDAERVVPVEHLSRQSAIHASGSYLTAFHLSSIRSTACGPSTIRPSTIRPTACYPTAIRPRAIGTCAIMHGAGQDLPGGPPGDHQVAG